MQVKVNIDPDCGELAVTITAPALTDEVKALAARLEGEAPLMGWAEGAPFPIRAEQLLRCYGEEKGVKAQTDQGV